MEQEQSPLDPFWKEFEKMVAGLHRSLAPHAKVEHNEQLRGKISQELRQIDITIRSHVAGYEVLTIIDCKKRSRKVGIPEMQAFKGLRDDVGAHIGVIVSDKGFSKGALSTAKAYGIKAMKMRDTKKEGWSRKLSLTMCVHFLICIPMHLVFEAPDGTIRQLDPNTIVIQDVETQVLFKPIDMLCADWESRGDMEPGLYIKDSPCVDTDAQQTGVLRFGMKVVKESFHNEVEFGFLGLVDQHTGVASTDALQSERMALHDIVKNWKRYQNEAATPPSIVTLRIRSVVPGKVVEDDVKPHYPALSLKMGINGGGQGPLRLLPDSETGAQSTDKAA